MCVKYVWEVLKSDVLTHVVECPTCQANKLEHNFPADLLQPLPISTQKWGEISMDFITGVPKVSGKDCIFLVVDRLTKYAHFFSISMTYTAAQVVDLFFKKNVRLHGLPKTILSDRDK